MYIENKVIAVWILETNNGYLLSNFIMTEYRKRIYKESNAVEKEIKNKEETCKKEILEKIKIYCKENNKEKSIDYKLSVCCPYIKEKLIFFEEQGFKRLEQSCFYEFDVNSKIVVLDSKSSQPSTSKDVISEINIESNQPKSSTSKKLVLLHYKIKKLLFLVTWEWP